MTIKHRADPYAALRASRVRDAAKRPVPAPVKAKTKAASEPEQKDYSHLHGTQLRYGQISQPVEPRLPTQAEKARAFAQRMAEVAAQATGRDPGRLVRGPEQGVVPVDGSDLVAALRRREAERAAAAGRR